MRAALDLRAGCSGRNCDGEAGYALDAVCLWYTGKTVLCTMQLVGMRAVFECARKFQG